MTAITIKKEELIKIRSDAQKGMELLKSVVRKCDVYLNPEMPFKIIDTDRTHEILLQATRDKKMVGIEFVEDGRLEYAEGFVESWVTNEILYLKGRITGFSIPDLISMEVVQ